VVDTTGSLLVRNILKFAALFGAVAAAAGTPAHAELIFGLVGSDRIVTFDSATPGTIISSGAISGVAPGDTLTGLDMRPLGNRLYSVGTSGALYEITRSGGGYNAVSVGNIAPAPSGAAFGIDFNPTVDRLRFVSDTNQNLRINQNTMPPTTTVDGAITLNGTDAVDLFAVAYRNSRPGATSTVLYGLDALSDSLVRATNANAGTYVSTNVLGAAFAPLGFTFGQGDRVAFDISGLTNQGFFTINDQFYTVDQLTGVATSIGALGVSGITGITANIPEPATWAMMIAGFGMAGAATRKRKHASIA
jgi:hypothetical protein